MSKKYYLILYPCFLAHMYINTVYTIHFSLLDILGRLNHPNICKLYGAGHTLRFARFLVLERLQGGTLAQKFGYNSCLQNDRKSRKQDKFSYDQVLKYARDIAAAMTYCHHNQAIAMEWFCIEI